MDFFFDLQLFAGEKTEEPTAKRRADARKKGQVGRSQEISGAFVLLSGFFVLKILSTNIIAQIEEYTVYIYGNLNQGIDVETVMNLFMGMVLVLIKTAFPVMLAIMVIAIGVNLFQVGINFTTEPLQFKLDKLSPISGFKRMFSKRSLVELFKSLFKIGIIGIFLYMYLSDEIMNMPEFIYLDLRSSIARMQELIFSLVFQVVAVYLVMAVADYAYQKWQTTQDLKMSKDDIKEEMKQTEGDPQIKGKIRQKQRQMAMARMMQEVPKADVIITNPTHFAVALRYEAGMKAPEVVAKGQDLVAQKIKSIAREANVPIVENKPLARALYASVEIGRIVPPELYQSVAEVLAYVYRLKRRYA
ncbi:flagellar biosynthesis protein FlhB [Selenomonas sp. TAMA-11512]|uniref:flagellar biosynthesis protein FlhB n=1 Tax=Selenomonas sp. TAMA-11512 TaxID=3095337 RepID=UPI0030D16C5E